LKLINNDSDLVLQTIVTGSHLLLENGSTYKEIESDGIKIDFKVKILEGFVDEIGALKAMGIAQVEIAKIYSSIKPDLVLVIGDRYEILSAVLSAVFLKIPVAHIHGGEVTQGAFDDSIRHAITKMSHLHFVSTEKSKTRVVQMGEPPKNVSVVGGLGVDAISRVEIIDKNELEKLIGYKFGERNLIVTFHPETNSSASVEFQINQLLSALDKEKNINLIFTGVNADPKSIHIDEAIKIFVSNRPNSIYVPSLGQVKYFSSVSYSDGVIGNSSSGVLEIPSFKKATINIGDRQLGREVAESVIECELKSQKISEAIDLLYSDKFQLKLKNAVNPYGEAGASLKIYQKLKSINLARLGNKEFFDL
jgi:GDP/UDP-N,N'-diacetylbacillosamine 2-epimerase (hydrolysing)